MFSKQKTNKRELNDLQSKLSVQEAHFRIVLQNRSFLTRIT